MWGVSVLPTPYVRLSCHLQLLRIIITATVQGAPLTSWGHGAVSSCGGTRQTLIEEETHDTVRSN